jgi:hypothetical protein
MKSKYFKTQIINLKIENLVYIENINHSLNSF